MNTENRSTTSRSWHALDASEAARLLNADTAEGLAGADARQRLDRCGPNSLPKAPAPSAWDIALAILKDPMNLLLAVTAIVAILVGQPNTAVLVAILVVLNVVLGTKQELAAQASVQALETQQVPVERVRRDGAVEELEATALVPGDLLLIEAGDIVPADCRVIEEAALEVTESALTGESAPVPKDAQAVLAEDTALGDRTNLLFQSTSVTRGTATALVVETGTNTEVGKITAQIRYVMAGLFGVLLLMVLASLFGINDGNVLSPVLLLFVAWLAIEWPLFQGLLGTTDLSGEQWAGALALALVPSLVIETEKALRASRRGLVPLILKRRNHERESTG